MKIFSRRQFLKSLWAITALFAANRTGFSFAQNNETFEMLVVGDSLIWGQGLAENDKFYSLIGDWLQTELNKRVNLKVKAHSGATVFLHENDARLLQKGGMAETKTFHPEVALTFPTLKTQIETAKNEYQTPEKVDLIMLTGGLVDITVAGILDPFGKDKVLRSDIQKYCGDDMFRFLEYSANIFPNALFVVVGYFPIISNETDAARMFNAFLEAYNFPRPLKPLANNILVRQFFKPIKKKTIKRSRIWFEESNHALENAVNRLNQKSEKTRSVFVKSPLTESTALETKKTLLFRMEKNNQPNDALYNERVVECKQVLTELKKSIGFKTSIRQCEIAGIGHPNIEGSKAYAEAIKNTLKSILKV